MKIAYLGVKGLPSKSGTERVLEAVVKRLSEKFDITVYCASDYTPPDTKHEGIKLIRIPTLKGRHLKPISLGILSTLHAIFLGNYDIVHVHGVENCFLLPLLRLRYRAISTSHGAPGRMPLSKWSRTEYFLIRTTEYPFLYLSNYATAVSIMDKKYFQDQYEKKTIYIPNGVDQETEINHRAAQQVITSLGLAPRSFLLFIAGRIIERKGCHLLLEALDQLNEKIPVVIIGDMEQAPSYSQKLRELAHGHPVSFVPAIADKSILMGILGLCKIFVFPSTAEGMSIMLMEAASLGIPMICSDIPENREVLDTHVTYFRSEDSLDLARKISWALENQKELENLAQFARGWTKEHFSWDLIAAKYEFLYRKCMNGESVDDASMM